MWGPLPGQDCCLGIDTRQGGRDGQDVGCSRGAREPSGMAGS